MFKKILIPVAAFAVTVTAASAFTGDMLNQIDVDLSDTQVEVLEEMSELRQSGVSRTEIHAQLEAVGLDQDKMEEIRNAVRKLKDDRHEAVADAVEAGDYDDFKLAVAGTQMADKINSEAEFELFAEAYELREAGDREAARAIMLELGIERGNIEGFGGHRGAGAGHSGSRGEGVNDGQGRINSRHDGERTGERMNADKGSFGQKNRQNS